MRISLISLLFLPLCAAAEPTELWAKGVSLQTGWYDYNKTFDGSDNEQCWAITAANIINWWQNAHAESLPPDTPKGDAVVRSFVSSFSNAGSDPDEGISWWFTGNYTPGREDCAALHPGNPGAYLKNCVPAGEGIKGTVLTAMRGSQVNAQTATAAFIDGAAAGAAFWIGVSYTSPAGRSAMHSLNVWGVRFSAEGEQRRLCGIWIADSDDYKSGLTYVGVREDAGMLIFDCPDHPIYSRIPRIVIDTISTVHPTPIQKPDADK